MLALLTLVPQTIAWWWASRMPGATSLLGPRLLGLAGTLAALAISIWMFLKIESKREALRQSQTSKPDAAEQQRQMSLAKLEAQKSRQLLASSLNTLDMGLEIWDEQNRLVLYNDKLNRLHTNFFTPQDIGQSFETVIRRKLKRQLIPAAIGREEEWLAQRMAVRGRHKEPLLQELVGSLWINTYETRTPEGYLVTAQVDVTKLVRKARELEIANHHLAQQSSMDKLTGLANRRRFDEALATEWQRAARSGTPLSLLMIDIDHFKLFNDNYGHVAGDGCLRRVASVLERCVRRAGEMAARYGGEEFVLLLPGADMAYACETAQKCMDLMEIEAVPHVSSCTGSQVTFSIGVASLLPDAQRDPSTLVNAADAAMYRAKSDGRARFKVADQADWDIDKDTPRTQPIPLA